MQLPNTLLRTAPLSLLLAIGCDMAMDSERPSLDDASASRATVAGTTEMQASSVTAFRIEANGQMTAVSEPSDVEADGSYSVSVVLSEQADANSALVIAATEGTADGAVVVMTDLFAQAQTQANTMTIESTTEARVFLELVADGQTDNNGQEMGMIDVLISTEVAASASSDTDTERLADAVLGLLITLESSAEQQAAATDAMANDTSTELTAQTLFGLQFNEDDLAVNIHAAAELTSELAADDDATDVEAMLAAEIERIRAEIAAQIVESSTTEIGLSVTGTADVEEANDGLLGILDVDTGVELNLSSSWDSWSQSLMFVLETDLSAESRTALERADQAAAEAEAELELALDAVFSASTSAQARAEATAQAMADYEATVRADARVQAMADTDFGDAGAAAMTDVLLQVHASVN